MLQLQASSGIYSIENSPHRSLPAGKFQAGMIAQNLEPFHSNALDDINADEIEWAKQNSIKSFTGYPLIVENQLVGVMEMYSRKPFSEDIFYTLEIVANAIALGIQHKLAERKIKSSLDEKELLLREIHHRVKNNMQVISSLLNFQTRHIDDRHYIDMFNDSQNRIKSMALIHEKIYRSGSMAHIDFKDYVRSLSSELFRFYGIDETRIALILDIEGGIFEIDTAIPCGLLINELLTNALKHGFPDNREGEVKVILRKTDINGDTGFELTVSDNGVGIPADLDISNTKSLGMNLIATLAEHQLQGKLTLNRDDRTEFHVRFKKLKYKQRV
jgi:two-component sensor histidine kinase